MHKNWFPSNDILRFEHRLGKQDVQDLLDIKLWNKRNNNKD